MKKRFTILMAAMMLLVTFALPMGMRGQTTTTYTFSSKSWAASPANWTSGKDGNQFQNGRGVQVTTGASGANATSPVSFENVSQIVVTYSTNASAGAGSISFQIGSNTAVSQDVTKTGGTTDRTLTYSFTPTQSGPVKLTVTCTTNSIYVKSVVITTSGGTPTPTMSVSTNAIAFGDNPINPSSPYTETFDVTFANLTQNLTVAGFSGITVSPATINYNGTSPQTVTVTYNPTAVGSISGNITVSNTDDGLSQTIAVTGSAYDPSNIDTYELYTGALVEGDYVICANAEVAMKNVISSNRFANETVTVTNNAISNPDASIIWHIAPEGAYFTMYNAAVGKYAAGTTSNNQGALIDNVTDYALWNISYSYSNYTVICYGRDGSNNKYLRRNGTYGWGTYANGTGNVPTFYKKVAANQVAMPTFSIAGGTYYSAQSVELSCATSGATIYYTTDGSTPTTSSSVYSTAIPVSATTTIKAFAVATGMTDSDVATATYTIELPLSTMDQIFARATEIGNTATAVRIAFNNWVVSAANSSSHTFVTDGTKGFMIYQSSHGFAAGDILSGTVECNLQLYNGAAEVTGLTSTTSGLTVTTGGNVTVANIAMADLSGINTGALVSYDDLACSEETSGSYTNYYLTDGTTTIQAYHTIIGSLSGLLEDGKTYNLTGVYCQNNSTKRINPRGATDIEEVVPASVSYYYSINGVLGSENTCAVGSTKTLETAPDLYSNFTFAGWTTAAHDVSQRLTEYTFPDDTPVTFYAVYAHSITTAASSKDGDDYTKVNSITDGEYLIVHDFGTDEAVAFNGTVENNWGRCSDVTMNDGVIESTSTVDGYVVTIASVTDGYTILCPNNEYMNWTEAKKFTTGSEPTTYAISFDADDNVNILSYSGSVPLRYNHNSGSGGLRSYASGQEPIQLYKKVGSGPVVVTNYYTRVFNETATSDIIITGPAIIPSFATLDMGVYNLDYYMAPLVYIPYIVIEEGGQMIFHDDIIKMETFKNITAPTGTWGEDDNTGWYAFSSPIGYVSKLSEIDDFTLPDVGGVRQYDFFAYSEKCGWYNKKNGSYLRQINEGVGYLYARAESILLSIRGESFNEDVDLEDLTYTSSRGNLAGLHCIGNPYTHNIYKGVGITGDMQANYYALNEATGAWISTTDATAIVPTQAILVFVNKTDGTAAIHMTSDNSAPSKKANDDYIKFNVANSKYEDVAYAWFDNGESLNKISHRNSEVPMLYIPQNDGNYSIAYMSDNTEMFNLNFKAMTAGKYTLSVSEKGDFSYLHVYDRLTGEDVDMLLDSYTFIGSPVDNEARFIVRLSYNASTTGSETFAFQNGSDVIVNGNGELQVFDLTGRMVMNTTVNGIQAVSMPQGVYVLRMIGENVQTQKIVVR